MPFFIDDNLDAHRIYTRVVGTTRITYSRAFFEQDTYQTLRDRFVNRASGVTSLGVLTSASMLVVGSGFGYLMEELINLGITDVWGIEPGGFFWDPANDSEWAPGMKARTAQDWIGSGTEAASLQAIGVSGQAKFNWIIDEDTAPCHSDAEIPAFIAALEARLQGNVKGRIVHAVSPLRMVPGDVSQNWKTMTDWEAFAPDHTWVDVKDI